MPPTFQAPLPISNPFGPPLAHRPRDIEADDAWQYGVQLVERLPNGPLRRSWAYMIGPHPRHPVRGPALVRRRFPQDLYEYLRDSLIIEDLCRHLFETSWFALVVAKRCKDILTVDDGFLAYIHPGVAKELSRFIDEGRHALGADTDPDTQAKAWGYFCGRVGDWWKHQARGLLGPEGLDKSLKAHAAGEIASDPSRPECWHPQPHERFVRRGQKGSVERRASTWGTYIIAWLVGSETVAVRLWNRMLLPNEFRWSPGRPDADALATYVKAKRRLIEALGTLVPKKPRLRPYPALAVETVARLEGVLEFSLDQFVATAARPGPGMRFAQRAADMEYSLEMLVRRRLTDAAFLADPVAGETDAQSARFHDQQAVQLQGIKRGVRQIGSGPIGRGQTDPLPADDTSSHVL